MTQSKTRFNILMALCEKKNYNREIQLKSDDWHCEVETWNCLSEPLALYKALIRCC